MRKKSHVSLSLYILNNIDSTLLEEHRKAFIVGSILPDCKPSFVTTKHNMEETFELFKGAINKCTVDSGDFKNISTSYCRKLGEITHYLADYFTYPHNDIFDGNMRAHCMYEKQLKLTLRNYIKSGDINVDTDIAMSFTNPDELFDYVLSKHREYLLDTNNVMMDCTYIVPLCHIAVVGILNLLNMNRIHQYMYA